MRRALAAPLVVWACLGGVARADLEPVTVPANVIVLKDSPLEPPNLRARLFKLVTRHKDEPDPAHHVVVPPVGGPGDPTIHGATLTVYNAAGRPLSTTVALPASRWSVMGSASRFVGYKFHDDTPADGPVFRVFVKPDRLFVAGGRALWTYALDDTPQGAVGVRLQLGTDVVWCAAGAPVDPLLYDRPDRFKVVKLAAPSSCPAVPAP